MEHRSKCVPVEQLWSMNSISGRTVRDMVDPVAFNLMRGQSRRVAPPIRATMIRHGTHFGGALAIRRLELGCRITFAE